MFCSKCGTKLSDTDRFCTNCGTPVAEQEPQAPVDQPITAPAQETPVQEATAQEAPAQTDFYIPPQAPAASFYTADAAPSTNTDTFFTPAEGNTADFSAQSNTQGTAFAPAAEEKDALAGQILKFGIMSLIFSYTGLLAIVGWILGAKCNKKVSAYTELYGEPSGKTKVGKILGTVGKIMGIVYTFFIPAYFIFCFAIGFLSALLGGI